jgi:hypothetical protein
MSGPPQPKTSSPMHDARAGGSAGAMSGPPQLKDEVANA